jgi:hypothetical protein
MAGQSHHILDAGHATKREQRDRTQGYATRLGHQRMRQFRGREGGEE